MQQLLLTLCLMLAATTGNAQPKPGDVFREYVWAKPEGDAGGSLRVGGRLDYGGKAIPLPHSLDLEHATRAEIVAEKLLCHAGTRGLAIAFNGHEPIMFPEATGIPDPQWRYQHFTFPVAPVPLDQLRSGGGNSFALKVDPGPPPNWPQNLVYGLQLRVYYDAARKPHPKARLAGPVQNGVIGRTVELAAAIESSPAPVARVDFLAELEDVNWEGDGNYRQWHHTYFKGALTNHLGSAALAPWKLAWDTSWVPDQREPVRLAARVTDATGLTAMTAAVEGLRLSRAGLSVELCRPAGVPEEWVTRKGERSQAFHITGDLRRATAARAVWSSWSPAYMAGLFINGTKVLDAEGPHYACYWHRVPITDLSVLLAGANTLSTGMTPKHNGKMVHGMEVNWPGVMLVIQYRTADAEAPRSKLK